MCVCVRRRVLASYWRRMNFSGATNDDLSVAIVCRERSHVLTAPAYHHHYRHHHLDGRQDDDDAVCGVASTLSDKRIILWRQIGY